MVVQANTGSMLSVGRTLVCCVVLLWGAAQSRAQAPDEKAQALEAAYKAGILSEEEYARKKAELASQAADGTLREKLQALDAAYQAGVLSDEEYSRKKAELTGTPAAAQAPPEPDATGAGDAASPTPAKTAGNTYQHPSGASFWYPSGWKPQMLEGILQLVPPDAGSSAEDFETYFVTAEDVTGSGITQANHPMVSQYLDEQMQELGSGLNTSFQRKGEPIPVKMSKAQGGGIRVDWTAQSQIGELQARTYVCILNNQGFVLVCLGMKERLAKRENDILRMFSSFTVGERKADSQIMGTWRLTSTSYLSNNSPFETDYSRAKMASEDKSTFTFNADGTWAREDTHYMIAGGGGVWLENNDTKTSKGRWSADGATLSMVWEDNSSRDFPYRIEGNQLKLVCGETLEVWTRAE